MRFYNSLFAPTICQNHPRFRLSVRPNTLQSKKNFLTWKSFLRQKIIKRANMAHNSIPTQTKSQNFPVQCCTIEKSSRYSSRACAIIIRYASEVPLAPCEGGQVIGQRHFTQQKSNTSAQNPYYTENQHIQHFEFSYA